VTTKATITKTGAILLGKNTACDAHEQTKPIRVVTHAHADHMTGLRESIKTKKKILLTPATKDLIEALKGKQCLTNANVQTLSYGKQLEYGDERITLLKADHILGAAQVLVEDHEGTRIVNTGDFRIDETPVIPADILVIEATYGSPWCRRAFGKDVKNLLVSAVERGLRRGTVYVFGYYGKLQEIMQILTSAGVECPFIMPPKVYAVSKASEKHGMHLGHLLLSDTEEGREMIDTNSTCIGFYHMGSRKTVPRDSYKITVTGWEFGSASRQISEKEHLIALSDHSDFAGLVEYVSQSKPKLVITDSYRVGHGKVLARELNKRFAIPAVALPKD
jgi:putative mRNA 3-end processing factor